MGISGDIIYRKPSVDEPNALMADLSQHPRFDEFCFDIVRKVSPEILGYHYQYKDPNSYDVKLVRNLLLGNFASAAESMQISGKNGEKEDFYKMIEYITATTLARKECEQLAQFFDPIDHILSRAQGAGQQR